MILFRPVGEKELNLIIASGYTEFPPRLPEQPIFYPVINIEYAREIASKWNINDVNSSFKGYVLKFNIADEYINKFNAQTVGSKIHQELWIPAEELNEFNKHIKGKIEIIEEYLS